MFIGPLIFWFEISTFYGIRDQGAKENVSETNLAILPWLSTEGLLDGSKVQVFILHMIGIRTRASSGQITFGESYFVVHPPNQTLGGLGQIFKTLFDSSLDFHRDIICV